MRIYNETPWQIAPLVWQIEPPQFALCFIVKGTFELRPNEPAVFAEEAAPISGDVLSDSAACRYPSDFVPLKPKADLLLVGHAHAKGGKPVARRDVAFCVGEQEARLRVTGDRYWLDPEAATISNPTKYTSKPLGYESAFGGPGYPLNPVGKGAIDQQATEPELRPLPNIEDPNSLLTSPDSAEPPAGFGPLAPTWGHRAAMLGSYDARWLQERWPWYPEDFDAAYFNSAPPALQREGYLRGDEEIVCTGLHADHERYRSELPGLKPRLFVNALDTAGEERFDEVQLVLDTLWIDMDSEKLVLCWRGHLAVRSESFDEVEHLYLTSESLSTSEDRDAPPLTVAEQQQAFAALLAAEQPAPEVVRETLPENDNDPSAEQPAQKPGLSQKQIDELIPVLESANAPAELIARIKAGEDPAEVFEIGELSDEDEARLAELEKKADDYARQILIEHGEDPALLDREGPQTVVLPTPAWTRARVEICIEVKESMAQADLSELDLSELDFSGADLSGAVLHGVDLSRAQLSTAKLAGASLVEARLTDAQLCQADLSDADLSSVSANNADLSRCVMQGAVFDGADLTGAKLLEAEAAGASFLEATLEACSFDGADLQRARLSRSRLHKASFRGASMRDADIEGADASEVDMTEALIEGVRASGGTSLQGAVLRRARGDGSKWMDAKLTEADLSLGSFVRADLRGADLSGAKLVGCNLKDSDLCYATLDDAQAAKCNLHASRLEGASLLGADLRDAVLYEAELWKAQLDEAQLDGAHVAMSKLATAEVAP